MTTGGRSFWSYAGEGFGVFLLLLGLCLVMLTFSHCTGCGNLTELVHGPAQEWDCPTTCADGSAPYWEDGRDPAQ